MSSGKFRRSDILESLLDDIGNASSDEDGESLASSLSTTNSSSDSSSDESIFELNEPDSKQNSSLASAKQSITPKRLFKKAVQPKRTIIPRNVSKALKKKSVKAKIHLTPQLARKSVIKKRGASTRSPAPKKKQTKKTKVTVNLDEETNTEYISKNGQHWSKSESANKNNYLKNFNINPGLKPNVVNKENLTDFFMSFINENMINKIVFCTNQRIKCPVNILEIKAYIGLLLIFGVTRKRDVCINEIWNTDSLHHLFLANATMTRERFKEITSNILFDDLKTRNLRSVTDETFFKFSEIFSEFQDNLRNVYEPGRQMCVDETLYAFRGRFKIRQYMKSKPAKYGIKFYNLVDVETSILLECNIYLGKSNTKDLEMLIGEQTVLDLCKNYYFTSRSITMDNFFTTVSLADALFEKNLTITGTFRSNKVFNFIKY